MSLMHRFVYNEVLKLTRIDITAKSPLGGTTSNWYKGALHVNFDNRFWKDVPSFIFVFCSHFLSIFNRLSYSTFSIWLGFPLWRQNFGGFGGKMTPTKWKFRKTLARRALSWLKPRLLSHRALESAAWFGLWTFGRKKNTYIHTYIHTLEMHIRVIFHHRVGAPFLNRLRWNLAYLQTLSTQLLLSSLVMIVFRVGAWRAVQF